MYGVAGRAEIDLCRRRAGAVLTNKGWSSESHGMGMAWGWHGDGMGWHGMGMAWNGWHHARTHAFMHVM